MPNTQTRRTPAQYAAQVDTGLRELDAALIPLCNLAAGAGVPLAKAMQTIRAALETARIIAHEESLT